MRIGIVGAGNIGQALVGHFVALGHDVAIANSRSPDTLAELVEKLGPTAQAVTPAEAFAFGDLLVVTVPLKAVADLPTEGTAGKTLIDTCNYYPQRDGQFAQIDDGSKTESEVVAEHFKEANVVKAFNSIQSAHLAEHGKPAGDPARRAIPIAGASPQAKAEVAQLIDQIGFDAVDAGGLSDVRAFENGGPLYGSELGGEALAAALREA